MSDPNASFEVRDLDTGEVYTEKDLSVLLKKVADPAKVLPTRWFAAPVSLPRPIFDLETLKEEEEAPDSPSASAKPAPHRIMPTAEADAAGGAAIVPQQPQLVASGPAATDPAQRRFGAVTLPEPDAELTFVRISGTGTMRDSEGKPFTLYFVEVRCRGAQPSAWTVYRRYSTFQTLNDDLRAQCCTTPPLPPKRFLGVLDRAFVAQRRMELESWLYRLVDYASSDPSARDPLTCGAFRMFLLEGANDPPFPMEVNDDEERQDDWNSPSNAMLQRRLGNGNGGDGAGGENSPAAPGGSKAAKVGLEDFELIRVVGKGSFGKVTLVRKKSSGRYYAMKVLTKAHLVRSKQVEHTRTERRVLGHINHPFVVSLHYAFQTESKLYFVLDYCPGGELFFHLTRRKKLPEYMARFYAAEMTLALEHLHAKGIVYRDLKPENILLDAEGHVKLADFGLAKEGVTESTAGASSLCGTPEYLSPEILNRRGHGTAVDWWSLGMVLYEMLTGLPPWYTSDRKKLFGRLRRGKLSFPPYVSHVAADLISGLLNRVPDERLGSARCGGAAAVKAHRFFAAVDWEALLERRVKPPFNPCKQQDPAATLNFEKQFTKLPLHSVSDSVSINDSSSARGNGGSVEADQAAAAAIAAAVCASDHDGLVVARAYPQQLLRPPGSAAAMAAASAAANAATPRAGGAAAARLPQALLPPPPHDASRQELAGKKVLPPQYELQQQDGGLQLQQQLMRQQQQQQQQKQQQQRRFELQKEAAAAAAAAEPFTDFTYTGRRDTLAS